MYYIQRAIHIICHTEHLLVNKQCINGCWSVCRRKAKTLRIIHIYILGIPTDSNEPTIFLHVSNTDIACAQCT